MRAGPGSLLSSAVTPEPGAAPGTQQMPLSMELVDPLCLVQLCLEVQPWTWPMPGHQPLLLEEPWREGRQ